MDSNYPLYINDLIVSHVPSFNHVLPIIVLDADPGTIIGLFDDSCQ